MIAPELTPECLADLSTRGPRYTSYPPATEFGAIDDAAVLHELERARDDGPASLYVHVPFCKSLCWYCGCNVIATRDASRGDRYVESVATEMALLAKALGPGFPIAEVALGGGSPNFLTPAAMQKLVMLLRRYFAVAADARMSVELDPRETSPFQVETLAALGFHTVSVGVQDFTSAVQDAIHRHQSRVQTAALIDVARTCGFTDVNIDIVYGLPRQTESSFATTLDAIIELHPERIALFGYAHLPSKLPHQLLVERAGRVLDRYERASLLLLAIDQLTAAGYIHIGLDHFARPGSSLARAATHHRLVRTFQGYVEQRSAATFGVGTSAISSTPRMFWQNHLEMGAWEDAIAAERLPLARGLVLDRDDQIRRAVINALMCDGFVDLDAIEVRFGIAAPIYFTQELAALSDLGGLASYDAATNTISTTPLGKLLVRNVCMSFDRYLRPAVADEPRFSATI